jgi:predicted nucleic acid-binding protein
MAYLLDTNTVIALMKGKDAVVGRVREAGLAVKDWTE